MRTIAFIPARYAASRLPGKLLKTIGGKSIIRMVYENAILTKLFDEVVVVTDSDLIFNEISSIQLVINGIILDAYDVKSLQIAQIYFSPSFTGLHFVWSHGGFKST